MKQKHTVLETDFHGLNLVKRGKVRDIYDLGDKLLMVVTDRISAFDVVMPDPLPGKGIILTQISLFWFDIMQSIIPNHVITADVDEYPEICRPYADSLRGRSMLVKKAVPLPVECIARGYISGSGWKSYKKSGDVCGIKLPPGLKESEKLPQPLFTPSTKADEGLHDINIEFKEAENLIGKSLAGQVRDLTLAIYEKGSKLAAGRGIIIADTKFEFGLIGNDLILIDEVLTPDSSRFWPKAFYEPGGAQKSFDKQYLRDYLNSLAWDKTPPGPSLPQEIINKTRSKYLEALTLLTGSNHGL
ncbi:MAG: phosphoribosylaminoimidazolesuccinocarboxamide synthase [Deltaproteobacteria bacterium]|nr:phosphoribosylaminoimidazolesuccinocarboxamide synthase [Deltaproteobacteria bacterium]